MRLHPWLLGPLCCACALLCMQTAPAQSPQPPDIATYIHQSWDKLQRSTSDCASLADPKLTTAPILYLPANERFPSAVKDMQSHCHVDVRNLPRTIEHIGDLDPATLPPGLLYLPHPYVVPGGRFNEMYGWDSYFIILGELADNRLDLARGTVENFFYEIEHYGGVLNANRTYYLTRSQPPLLSSMVMEVYRAQLRTNPKNARAFLKKSLPYLTHDHELWTTAPHLAGITGLSRYYGLGIGPVPELADDSTYYVDVLHWLLAHPDQAPHEYFHKLLPRPTSALTSQPDTSTLSSRPERSAVERPAVRNTENALCATHCPAFSADGYELTSAFFTGDRAMRESGFDTTFRFGPFGGSTENYAPVGLNALLFKYERDVAFIYLTFGDIDNAIEWSETAGNRLARIDELLWDDNAGLYFDLDITTDRRSTYNYITAYYALWCGIASPAEAKKLVANLQLFERPGGLQTSTTTTGVQWDAPFGWAPTNYIAVAGLRRYGYTTEARRIATEFTSTIAANYARDGTIREKYNVADPTANVAVSIGYKTNVIGFGWTNAVYIKLQQLLTTTKPK
jgi:alpha,alpha-trehalase